MISSNEMRRVFSLLFPHHSESRLRKSLFRAVNGGSTIEFRLKRVFRNNHEVKKRREVNSTVLNIPSEVSLPLNDCPAKITTIVKNVRARKQRTHILFKNGTDVIPVHKRPATI